MEVQQVNLVINARLYICSNLLPFSTSTSVSFYFIFKMFKYVSFKKKEGGIYCSQDKWESTSLYYIPYIVSDCYNTAATCRWNGTYFRRGET